jgi:protoporphyrinogen oxidase
VNLGLRRPVPGFGEAQWVYLPERRFRAYRVGFYNRLSDAMSPPGCEAVYVEIAHAADAAEREVVAAALTDLTALGAIEGAGDVELVVPVRIPGAYVIHDRHCAPARERILGELAGRGLHMIGRYGRWEYASIEDALEQGIDAATRLLGTLHGSP